MSNNCTARNDLLVALHTLASHFENALYAFGDDDEARKKAEGDIAWARLVASRHNYNGSECKEIERLRGLVDACAIYLKEDETPAQRIERERVDTEAVLKLLSKEKREVERLRGLLEEQLACQGPELAQCEAEIERLLGLLEEIGKQHRKLAGLVRGAQVPCGANDALDAIERCVRKALGD